MQKKEKKMIVILLIILIIAIAVFVINNNKNKKNGKNAENENTAYENEDPEEFVQVLEDGSKINTSEELNKTKQIGTYKFENIQLAEQNNQTVLLANVTNTGNKATEMQLVDITLLNKNGEEIITIGGIIEALEPGANTQFNSSMTLDYTNVYDFKITLK